MGFFVARDDWFFIAQGDGFFVAQSKFMSAKAIENKEMLTQTKIDGQKRGEEIEWIDITD